MLGKLMKYEFKATGRIFLPMFGALIVVAAVNRLFMGPEPQRSRKMIGTTVSVVNDRRRLRHRPHPDAAALLQEPAQKRRLSDVHAAGFSTDAV